MEALRLPGRGRLGVVAETAAAPGLGPWLLGLMLAATAYAAFADGAIDVPAETRFQIGIAAIGMVAAIGVAAGTLRNARAPLAWIAVATLAGFGLISGISTLWSAAPDASWLAANRAGTYALIAAVALLAAFSVRDAQSLAIAGIGIVIAVVAAYALGGKLFPWAEIGGFGLDPGNRFARVRDPIGYWNALGLLCVMGTPPCIWLAASRTPAPRVRIGGVVALTLLLVTATLTYSRGAIVAYLAVLAVMVGAGPRRLPRLFVGFAGVLAAAPSAVLAFSNHRLADEGLSLASRSEGGAMLLAALAASLLGLGLAARAVIRREGRGSWSPLRTRRIWRVLALLLAGLVLAGVGAIAASPRGFTGEISHQVDEFQEVKGVPGNSPERLVSSNGSNRYVWWQEALGAFSDKPLAGWGAGSYPVVRFLYRRYPAPVRSAHSVPLQFLSETGLLGAALGLGALALLGAAAVGQIRRSTGVERSARLALASVAAAWAVHSLYDWDWEIPAVTVPALIAICFAAAPIPGPERPAARKRRRRWTQALAGAGAALAAAAIAVSVALPSLSEGDRLDALALAGSSEDLGKAGAAGTASASGDSSGDAEALVDAAARAELAHRLNPLSLEPLFAAASIANRRGRFQEAAGLVEEATRIQPDNWEGWRRLSELEAGLQDTEAAAEAFRRWGETDPLTFENLAPTVSAYLFALEAPPAESPTAFGTPPP
jgi:O-antigen ligase/polysaccharide polymerase Wzy-like membrane protein